MRTTVIVCGGMPSPTIGKAVRVPERPGRDEVDYLLAEAAERSDAESVAGKSAAGADVIVAGTDNDLAAVVLRLLRTDRLEAIAVGYVPAHVRSAFAELWRLPSSPTPALRLAQRGEVDPVPLIRDDTGGLMVARGTFRRVRGFGYCDENPVLNGPARSVQVEPDNTIAPGTTAAGLVVHVTRGRLKPHTTTHSGRAFQLGCHPNVPDVDGRAHPRQVTRWTWYRHSHDLRLVRGIVP